MRAYLDNNIVSAIAKNDTPAESDAIKCLLDADDEGKVDLVTSELTLQPDDRHERELEREVRGDAAADRRHAALYFPR